MPTDPSKINVQRIVHVSDDINSNSKNELLTARAVQRKSLAARGTMPLLLEFDSNALDGNGELHVPYVSDVDAVHVAVVTNLGVEVKVPVRYISNVVILDLSASGITPGAMWTVTVWTDSGQKEPFPDVIEHSVGSQVSSMDFMRARIEDLVDLRSGGSHVVYTVPEGYNFVLEHINVNTNESPGNMPPYGINTHAGITLVASNIGPNGPYTVINDNTVHPLALATSFDVTSDVNTVFPAGTILTLSISTPAGSLEGNDPYTAYIDISGYLSVASGPVWEWVDHSTAAL